MLLVVTLLTFLVGSFGQLTLNIRDGDKICTAYIPFTGSSISLNHWNNPECAKDPQIFWDPTYTSLRLCCLAILTTPAPSNFPRECGKQYYQPSTGRIVGGNETVPNSWPWQVRLHLGGGLCGGALIDERHVLTAAHCFSLPLNLPSYQVIIGLHTVNEPVQQEQIYSASRVFLHEQYNDMTNENDMAIIRLAKPVTISAKVNVICLPGPEAINANETVWVAGWGTTSFGGSVSPVLRQTVLHTMPSICPRVYAGSRYDNTKQMCAGAHGGGRDSCQGDSGGPLMYESNGVWYVNGVVSYGNGCARADAPGVYARVNYYLNWIRAKVATA